MIIIPFTSFFTCSNRRSFNGIWKHSKSSQSLKDFYKNSSWFWHYFDLDGLYSSFSFLQSLFQVFGDCFKSSINNWYHCHLSTASSSFWQVPSSYLFFVFFFIFTVWNSKIRLVIWFKMGDPIVYKSLKKLSISFSRTGLCINHLCACFAQFPIDQFSFPFMTVLIYLLCQLFGFFWDMIKCFISVIT